MSACGQAALSSCGPPRTDAWLCPVPVPVVRTVILRLSSQGRGSICRVGRVPGATHFRSPAAGTAFHEARRREKSMALGALGDINGGLFPASAGLRAPHSEAKIAPGNAPGGHLTPPWKTSHRFPQRYFPGYASTATSPVGHFHSSIAAELAGQTGAGAASHRVCVPGNELDSFGPPARAGSRGGQAVRGGTL